MSNYIFTNSYLGKIRNPTLLYFNEDIYFSIEKNILY